MHTTLLPREITPDTVLPLLQVRIGAANGITAHDLVATLRGDSHSAEERRLRLVIEQLRLQGYPICAHPNTGYWWAATADELDAACEFLYARALASLQQISAMRHVALPDLRGQLGLPLPAKDASDV